MTAHKPGSRNTKWPRRIFPLLALLIATVLYLQYSHIFYCEMIRFSTFTRIDENMYVSPGIPEEDYREILAMRREAENRIADFWGEKRADAVMIVCAEPEEYEKYCHSKEGAGCSLGTLYGSSFIVLNLYGLNTDVISHEMCHSELFGRLGWRKTTFDIPQWFHEGLSMMLDYRFVNASDSIIRYHRYVREWRLRTKPPAARLALEDIHSLKGFFDRNSRHVTLAYITAATEVSYWLMVVGREGLREWEEAMKAGDGFNSYYDIEKRYYNTLREGEPGNPVRRLSLAKPAK